ncbi:MAG: tricorn protease, partial [Streptomyces sp.]|nr:tricorn protease [Streptomyces sp.]
MCFAAEDDIWVAPLGPPGASPGRAWRITADRTRVGHPRFSPDGAAIAFTNWRSLDPEIHLAPVDGGPARRLTYWGSFDTRVRGWNPDGQILAVSSHGQPFSYFSWAYNVPTDGSPGGRLPWGPVSDIAVRDADGEHRTLLLSGTPPHEPAAWKRYRGGATGRLWLHGERLVPDLDGHLESPMFVGDRIAFLSDHEGVGNLYSCAADGSDVRRHTDHADFYARSAATDGSRVVYQCAGEIWLVDDLADPAALPRRLDVSLGGPRAGRRPYQVPAASYLDAVACDRTGRASAVCVRGSLYWLTHRDGPARTIADEPGARVRIPEMLGETGRIAFITDAEGEDAIEIADLPGRAVPVGQPEPAAEPAAEAATGEPTRPPCGSGGRRLAVGKLGRVHELISSPDGETLAVAANDGRLLLVDAAVEDGKGEVTELARSTNGPVRDLAFSPDSAWLAWSHPGIGRSLRMIRIAKLADRTVIDVTNGRFEDEQPVFTRDGRYLAFLSWRGFDPVYDVHTGDLSFPLGCRPYLVPLNSATPSPFALPVEGRPAVGGLDPVETGSGPVAVEAEGLPSRVTPFPVPASKYSSLEPVRGGVVWLRWPISGALGETFVNPADPSARPSLEFFDLAKSKRTELVHHMDWYRVSGDGSRLVVYDDGELTAVPANELGDLDSTVYIDMRRILHDADPAAEWRQSFDEAGRIIRDYFWAPDMCGIDWP